MEARITMPSPETDTDLVDSIQSLEKDVFELWKYFEDRADELSDRLWTTGTWLTAILAAILVVPFTAKFIEVQPGNFPLSVGFAFPVILVSLFGIAFGVYALLVLKDIKEHIETNWRKAKYIRKKNWDIAIGFRKSGWRLLRAIISLEVLAFAALLILGLVR
jgi:hypothetical protein